MELARIGTFLVRDEDISEIKLELIRFFKDNPGTIDMASSIALRLGRSPCETEKALEELADKNICRKLGRAPVCDSGNGHGHDTSETLFAYAPSIQLFERLGEAVPEMNPGTRMNLVTMLLNRTSVPTCPRTWENRTSITRKR